MAQPLPLKTYCTYTTGYATSLRAQGLRRRAERAHRADLGLEGLDLDIIEGGSSLRLGQSVQGEEGA